MKVLIADDNKYIREVVKEVIKNDGYEIFETETGLETLKIAKEKLPDLIVLDIVMPLNDGISVLSTIRQKPEIYGNPMIMMLTSKVDAEDVTIGFEQGADDYLKKPFEKSELNLRIKALLKRKSQIYSKILKYKNITVDIERNSVKENNNLVKLTKKELSLLKYLIANKEIVLSKEKIMEAVWETEYFPGCRNVDIFVKQLRDKFTDINSSLETIYGIGFILK